MSRLRASLLLALAAAPVMAQDWAPRQSAIVNRPELNLLLEPPYIETDGAYVQGQIRLRVQLLSPRPFEALNLNVPAIEGARVVTLATPRTREMHIYGQSGYVHETRIAIFPERSGELHIPAITASGVVAPGAGEPMSFNERWEGTRLSVRPINANFDSHWWMVADRVTTEELWQPEPDELRVGDTAQRRLELAVHGITAEQLPTIVQGRNAGYAVVGTTAETRTERTPDGVVAHLRQTWDIRIESEQVFYVSPIRIDYWDPAADRAAVVTVAAKRLEPLPKDVEALRAQLIGDAVNAHRRQRYGVYALLSLALLALLALLAAVVRKAMPTSADRRFRRVCANGASPEACFAALSDWSDDSFGYRGGGAVRKLRSTLGDGAAEQLEQLQLALFSAAAAPESPKGLAPSVLSAARRLRLRAFWRESSNVFGRLIVGPEP
ncbi:MAG: hypothetical protein ACR2RL_18550 [Gammaproteobacteria bacterium]